MLHFLPANKDTVHWGYFDCSLAPLGTTGAAPNVKGRVSSIPPGKHGGNIDNWRIGAGAAMYYPIEVDGALFSVGDPHISHRSTS